MICANLRALERRYPEYTDLVTAGVASRESDTEDPDSETLRHARALAEAAPALYVLVRPGNGHLALALLAALEGRQPGSIVLLIEDCVERLAEALGSVDWGPILYSHAAVLRLGSPYSVVESFLERHPPLALLPATIVAPPELAAEPEHGRFALRLAESAERLRDRIELALGAASEQMLERRERREPRRIVLAGKEFGHLASPIAEGFRACDCDVVVEPGSGRDPRGLRSHDWLSKLAEIEPDVVVWLNRPDVALPAREAMRGLGIANVLWSVDSPRRMELDAHDLAAVDAHACYDATLLETNVPRTAQLSLAAGVRALPGCRPSDEIWPERRGPELAFVGSLGEGRIRELREILRRRQPETLALLDELAGSADPARDYEARMGRRLEGGHRMYVDEVRSKRRRLEILNALADLGLSIYGDAEWAAETSLASRYARRRPDYGFELASIYYHARIALNVFHTQCVDATNSRVYDVLAAGGFLITEHRPQLAREFEIGRHLVTFRTAEEAREQVVYYASRPQEREAIAREGQRHVLREHVFSKRCRRLLDLL